MTDLTTKEFIGTHEECVEQAKKQGWNRGYYPVSFLNNNICLNTDSPKILGKIATNDKGEYLFKIDTNLIADYKLKYIQVENEEEFKAVYIDAYTNSQDSELVSKNEAKRLCDEFGIPAYKYMKDYKFD